MSTSQAVRNSPCGKMILVLDDETEVRKLVAAVLTRSGYKVVDARTRGTNAIKAHKRKANIRLISCCWMWSRPD